MQQDNLPQDNLQYQQEEQESQPFKVAKVEEYPPQNTQENNTLFENNEEPQMEAEAPVTQEEPQGNIDDNIESLRAKLAELEQQLQSKGEAPRVEYRMPEEVLNLLNNPETLSVLNEDYDNKSVLDLIKAAFKEANPWAKTDRHIEAHLRRQYPDIDFDIPENLGLAEEDYDAIAWQAEGIRQQLISNQNEIKGKLESATNNPAYSQEDLDGYQQQFNTLVEDGIKGIKPEPLALDIPGYKMPQLDFEKIKDIVYSEAVPLSLDANGNVWPNMKAAQAMAELEMLKSQIPAMLEAARRAAPKEAVEAMNRTLNNQVPQTNATPMDPKQIAAAKAPMLNGMRIMGVQATF
jgi:DNA-binding protein YbaB